jgi:hypothetical protein
MVEEQHRRARGALVDREDDAVFHVLAPSVVWPR